MPRLGYGGLVPGREGSPSQQNYRWKQCNKQLKVGALESGGPELESPVISWIDFMTMGKSGSRAKAMIRTLGSSPQSPAPFPLNLSFLICKMRGTCQVTL